MAKRQKDTESQPVKSDELTLGIGVFIPLFLVLGVIPLIVRMKVVVLPTDVSRFWTQDYAADFFSYYKSIALILTAVCMAAVFGFYKAAGQKSLLSSNKALRIYFGGTAVLVLFALLSTLFSQYTNIALWGGPERREGMVMMLVYLLIMLYAMWAFSHKPEFKYIALPLGVLTFITGFLGAFQFFGHDLFMTNFGQTVIVPAAYLAQGKLQMLFEYGKIYGTMYHYNYMGSFGSMMVPLFLVLALFLKDKKARIFCAAATAVALFALLGSTSRAGIVGLIIAAVCFIIFFAKKLKEHSKITVGCAGVLLVLVLLVNIVTGGLALARIPSLLNDMKAMVSVSDVDYHNEIAVRHIDLQADSATFVFQDGALTMKKDSSNQLVFIGEAGQTVTAPAQNSKLELAGHKMELQYVNGVPYLGLYVDNRIEFILGLYDEGFAFVDNRMKLIDYEEAPSIGFNGKEKLGSARGYIWSRSLPVMLESPIVGHGADTFFAVFPQGDLLAKLYAYDTAQMIVDKPHNMYLQMGINYGMIALAAFIVMMAAYIIESFKLYAMRSSYSVNQSIGAAVALAIIGYLGAGFFNDSIVSVAPIFWALFGVGAALNQLNKKEHAAEVTTEE